MHVDQYNKIVFVARVKRDDAMMEADLFRMEQDKELSGLPGWLRRFVLWARIISDPAEVQDRKYLDARRVYDATIKAAFQEYKSTGGQRGPEVMPIDPMPLETQAPMTLDTLLSKIGYPADMKKPSSKPN